MCVAFQLPSNEVAFQRSSFPTKYCARHCDAYCRQKSCVATRLSRRPWQMQGYIVLNYEEDRLAPSPISQENSYLSGESLIITSIAFC